MNRAGLFGIAAVFGLSIAGCRNEMYNQPKAKPLSRSAFFQDGAAARTPVDGTVARGELRADTLVYEGRTAAGPATVFPWPVTRSMLERGKERFDIYCSVCHGAAGYGDGMVVQRGFPAPPSFHIDRLRRAPLGHFFDVMTNGYGAMYSYAARVSPEDRWAIIAYIRALQLSQERTIADAPPEERRKLEEAPREPS